MLRGFTVVELLVVIAIIAIMVAITIPALARVRAEQRNLKSMNNLRTFGQALSMYLKDYDDYFVEPGFGSLRSKIIGPFLDAPEPSMDVKIAPWACPEDNTFWFNDGGYSYTYWPSTYWAWARLPSPNYYTKYKDLKTLYLYEKDAVYFSDALDWHFGKRNAVYPDDSVRPWF